MFGSPEVLIIAGVVLVLFGGAAIPRFARALGKARRELSRGHADTQGEPVEREGGSRD